MNGRENAGEVLDLRGLGLLILFSALFLTGSWALGLAFLEGDSLVTVRMFAASHHFALAFLFTAPLAYGARKIILARRAEGADLALAVALSWLRLGFLPTALYVLGLRVYEKRYFHASPETFFILMGAALLLGCYGFALTRKPHPHAAA